jgi:DNA-binding NarL/FixJ family response regulator
MSTVSRVVMADDHPQIRFGIRAALEAGNFVVVAEVGSAKAAIEACLEHQPDVALLDIHMPGNGISAAGEINRQLPDCAVVMLTSSRDDNDLFDSLRAGASGYLLKDIDPARLPAALEGVLSGEAAIPRTLVAKVLDEFRARPPRRFAKRDSEVSKLTSREYEVMELLGRGLSTDEVARRLFLSTTTVRVHVSTVLKKLRVKDRKAAFEVLQGE